MATFQTMKVVLHMWQDKARVLNSDWLTRVVLTDADWALGYGVLTQEDVAQTLGMWWKHSFSGGPCWITDSGTRVGVYLGFTVRAHVTAIVTRGSEQVVSGQEKAGLPACHWLTKRTQVWESWTNIKADQPHLVGIGWKEENPMKAKRKLVLKAWVPCYMMGLSHSCKDKAQRSPSGKNWLLPWESFKLSLINDYCPLLLACGRSFKCGQMASAGGSEGF